MILIKGEMLDQKFAELKDTSDISKIIKENCNDTQTMNAKLHDYIQNSYNLKEKNDTHLR